MTYSSRDMEHKILKSVVSVSDFCPFTSLKTPKIKSLKTQKIYSRYYHFTPVYQKSKSYVYGSSDAESDRHIF